MSDSMRGKAELKEIRTKMGAVIHARKFPDCPEDYYQLAKALYEGSDYYDTEYEELNPEFEGSHWEKGVNPLNNIFMFCYALLHSALALAKTQEAVWVNCKKAEALIKELNSMLPPSFKSESKSEAKVDKEFKFATLKVSTASSAASRSVSPTSVSPVTPKSPTSPLVAGSILKPVPVHADRDRKANASLIKGIQEQIRVGVKR